MNHFTALMHVSEAHSGRVAAWATALARGLVMDPNDVARIRLAAMLHDIGKVHVPAHILNKPGPLTWEEWAVVKHYPVKSEQMIRQFGIADQFILASVRHHTERMDGNGYPDGLRGEQIPLGARILAIANAWDTMVTPRPYRSARPFAEARMELVHCSGSQFDQECVGVFLDTAVRGAGKRMGRELKQPFSTWSDISDQNRYARFH